MSAKRTQPLDLVQVRQQLTALRNQHSENVRVSSMLNTLIVDIAYLKEPRDQQHRDLILAKIAKTLKAIERVAKKNPHRDPS